jgi:hypothetical protein
MIKNETEILRKLFMGIVNIKNLKDLIKTQNDLLKEIDKFLKKKDKEVPCAFVEAIAKDNVNNFLKISKEIQDEISKLVG